MASFTSSCRAMIHKKTSEEISLMRSGGSIVEEVLLLLKKFINTGISTEEIDEFVEDFIVEKGAKPAFKGYRGYPKSVCCSINDEVVHGIPSSRCLEDGDIIAVDVGVFKDGFYTDAAYTYSVGKISANAEELLRVTKQSLRKGIAVARAGKCVGDIGSAIQHWVERHGFSIVRDYVGHGIGRNIHEEPQIPNYGEPGTGPRLEPGMVLCLEPMVNSGDYKVRRCDDGWTVATVDGKLSAHFEDTIVVTDSYPEIITCLHRNPQSPSVGRG